MKKIVNTENIHGHEHVETGKLLIQEVRHECKRKATNDNHTFMRGREK